MKRKYPHLCQPITLGNVTFRNRMFASPIGATDIDKDCVPGERTRAFYELRAKGGAAAVTMSELVVHPETDGSHMLHLDLTTVGSLAAFTFCADSIKRHGAVPSVEFSHSGQYAGTYMADKNKKQSLNQFGPDDAVRPDGMKVKALTKGQITDIVKRYGETAALAKRAGFEMIMIHGGHTWLLNQFISPYFNHRTDEYGGCFENRMRFTIEVLKAVREAVGPLFPIEFRMSGSELFEGGYDIDEGIRIAQAVEEYVDLIHVSAGSYQFGFFRTHPSMFSGHGCNVYLAAEIKKHVKKPVATIGALNDPAQMEEIIASGKADVVYMGRALLADPYLPQKIAAGEDDKIVKCLRCFTCMAERPTTQTRRCTVNPVIGREIEGTEVLPSSRKKKVLVVGGGVAGLKAAVTAAQRGHEVILCEKSDKTGGILKCEQAIDFKREMYELGLALEAQAEEAGVEIRRNTEVTPEYAEKINPDSMILAVGSKPIVPPLPGMDGENVVIVNNYYLEKEKVGGSVVVLGGGLAGCEAAIHLAQEGKKVHLVEMRDTLAPDANIRHRPILMKMIDEYVEAHTGYQGIKVTADGVLCKDSEGREVLVPGKTVVCAVGQRADRESVNALLDAAPVVREIGDCVRPGNITAAIYQGYHAGLDI
ncbi:FAD-dependent oxidoreductase [[Clostridium] symbiosum]|uniref:oxidoreductase n=1 Tax=Clostridium symbiosum TaxID=1512 RepID=UPI001D07E083|nr:FAD-dependent oxidoreductase [[Clostridium] symbiosum]MCB6610960.1 NAD(P)/FAD-dependent oxidoreductase [[Clostridium] symbiosum]MCB6932102.1 NAD(P)/FAD-dependent oxidoreductase [[Clostridium] symbiosum]